MRFGNVGKGLAGLVVAGASLLGNVDNAKGTSTPIPSFDVTSSVYNTEDMDSEREGIQSRIDYTVTNTTSSSESDIENYYNSIEGLNFLNLGSARNVYDIQFDREDWDKVINLENTSTGSMIYTSNIQVGNDFMIISAYFDGTAVKNEGSVLANFASGSSEQVNNVVVPYIPEPATISMWGLGSLVGLFSRKKK